jgi:hypothetical protein
VAQNARTQLLEAKEQEEIKQRTAAAALLALRIVRSRSMSERSHSPKAL